MTKPHSQIRIQKDRLIIVALQPAPEFSGRCLKSDNELLCVLSDAVADDFQHAIPGDEILLANESEWQSGGFKALPDLSG